MRKSTVFFTLFFLVAIFLFAASEAAAQDRPAQIKAEIQKHKAAIRALKDELRGIIGPPQEGASGDYYEDTGSYDTESYDTGVSEDYAVASYDSTGYAEGTPVSAEGAHVNPPGPKGGPGAGPRFKKGVNPPGAKGGPGAGPRFKKGNPPGPKGGPGKGKGLRGGGSHPSGKGGGGHPSGKKGGAKKGGSRGGGGRKGGGRGGRR